MEPILMTPYDNERLCELVENCLRGTTNPTHALALEHELGRAVLVDESELPADVVTMNSQLVAVDVDTGEELHLSVVFPAAADVEQGQISVLAPIGIAMLGSREGDEITWRRAGRVRRLRIKQVSYQPEASGDLERLRSQFRKAAPTPCDTSRAAVRAHAS